ncbi:flagellar basal body protein [Parvibaculum sp.]|jgi:flagellar basal-body rod protein FlgB|uniref:flagellar basal body protein n=1 Tax=Parvibaculum sp. TaxID=2024848 RepID=UPI003C738161
MDLMGIPLFGVASDRMSYLAMRHEVIAENVANANTPKFVARDLKPFSEELKNAVVTMERTRPGHLPISSTAGGKLRMDGKSQTWELVPSGNGVSLEQEMLKASDTVTSYALVSNIYKSNVNLLSQAVSGPR